MSKNNESFGKNTWANKNYDPANRTTVAIKALCSNKVDENKSVLNVYMPVMRGARRMSV